MFHFDITLEPEVQLEMEDADSKRESLGSKEIRKLTKVFPGSRRKLTYRVIDGYKTPIQVSNWREVILSSVDFQDDPFRRIQEEIDQL